MFSRQILRRFGTSAIRRSHDDNIGGIPGKNLPFDIHNKYKLTALFILFFGSATAIPFLAVRHNLLKANR